MTTKFKLIVPATTLAVLLMAASAMAWHGQGRYGNCREAFRCQPAFSQLTAAKQADAEKVFDKYAKELYNLREDLWAKHTEMQALVDSGKIEKGEVSTYVEDMRKLKDQINDKRAEMRAALEKVTGLDFSTCDTIAGRGNCYGPQTRTPGHGHGHGQRGNCGPCN